MYRGSAKSSPFGNAPLEMSRFDRYMLHVLRFPALHSVATDSASAEPPADDAGRFAEMPALLSAVVQRLGERLDPLPTDLQCPPAFLPVAGLPLDGNVIGIALPGGRPPAEPPLALLDAERLHATYLGTDTRRSLGVLLGLLIADVAHDAAGDDGRAELHAIADDFGFDPALLPAEMPLGVLPRVPPGWRLARTADGLGVLAPTRRFAPDQRFDDDEPELIDPAAARLLADAFRRAGHHASALWCLRNAFVTAEEGERERLAEAVRDCRDDMAGLA